MDDGSVLLIQTNAPPTPGARDSGLERKMVKVTKPTVREAIKMLNDAEEEFEAIRADAKSKRVGRFATLSETQRDDWKDCVERINFLRAIILEASMEALAAERKRRAIEANPVCLSCAESKEDEVKACWTVYCAEGMGRDTTEDDHNQTLCQECLDLYYIVPELMETREEQAWSHEPIWLGDDAETPCMDVKNPETMRRMLATRERVFGK